MLGFFALERLPDFTRNVYTAIPPALSDEIAQSTVYHHLRQMEGEDITCSHKHLLIISRDWGNDTVSGQACRCALSALPL